MGRLLLPIALLPSVACVREPAGQAPTTAEALRAASEQAAADQRAEVATTDGRRLAVDGDTVTESRPVRPNDPVPERYFALRQLYLECLTVNRPCPLDQPDRRWTVDQARLAPDGQAIALSLLAALAVGAVALEGECFASWCSTGTKGVVVGVDVAAGLVALGGYGILAGFDRGMK